MMSQQLRDRGCHCPYESVSERDSGIMAGLIMLRDGVWISDGIVVV